MTYLVESVLSWHVSHLINIGFHGSAMSRYISVCLVGLDILGMSLHDRN